MEFKVIPACAKLDLLEKIAKLPLMNVNLLLVLMELVRTYGMTISAHVFGDIQEEIAPHQ